MLYPFPFDPKAAPPLPTPVKADAYVTDGRSLFRVLTRLYESGAAKAVLEDCGTLDTAVYGSDVLSSMGLRRVRT
jgi:hypothetical protein